jgi:hypothetical protein
MATTCHASATHCVTGASGAGVGRASTVFVMLPDSSTTISPRGQVVPEVATLTQRNALKVSTALRVSSLRVADQGQPVVLQDCSQGWKEIGYADKLLRCALCPCKYRNEASSCEAHLTLGQLWCSGWKAADKASDKPLSPALQPLGEHVMISLAAQCACRPGAHTAFRWKVS